MLILHERSGPRSVSDLLPMITFSGGRKYCTELLESAWLHFSTAHILSAGILAQVWYTGSDQSSFP